MPLISCPGCGHRVADVAPECPRCTRRYPGRASLPGDSATAPVERRKGMSGGVIAAIVIVSFFGLMLVLGIVAAIVLPKFASLTLPPGQAEADALLTRAYQGEVAYQRIAGAYTTDLASLQVPRGRFFSLSVTQASGGELCIDAAPLPGAVSPAGKLEPRSMDESGWLHESAGCQDQADLDQPEGVTAPASAAGPPSPR